MLYVARNKETKALLLLPSPHSNENVLLLPVWVHHGDVFPYLKAMHIEDKHDAVPFSLDEWKQLKNRYHASWTQVFLHLMETDGIPHGTEVK